MACVVCVQAVVELLVEHKADVNARNIQQQTPLHVVAANNSLNSLHSLLAFIDDINITDSAGRTALHHAAYSGHTQVSLLFTAAANVFASNSYFN